MSRPLAIDAPEEGGVPILESMLKKEMRHLVGGGRSANQVAELGYEQIDESISFYLQTARLLYFVSGCCLTRGTSYVPAKIDTIASGGGSTVLTLTTGGLTPDAHVNEMLIITAGDNIGKRYIIRDNDAGTITVDTITPANIDGDSIEILKAPFIHYIRPIMDLLKKVDSVASGGGTSILTLTIGGLLVNEEKGKLLVVTAGDNIGAKYIIIGNTSNTITVEMNTPANINNDTIEIIEPTSRCNPPTAVIHFHEPEGCDSGEDILTDGLGIMIRSNEIRIEKDGDGMQSVSFIGAKSVEGDLLPNVNNLPLSTFKWGHVSEMNVNYDGLTRIQSNRCETISMLVENDSEISQVVGDFYPAYQKLGTLSFTLKFFYRPTDRSLYDLRNVPVKNYASAITAVLNIEPSADRYINIVFNSLLLMEYPAEIPSKDDDVMGVEVEFTLMPRDNEAGLPEGFYNIESKDSLNQEYYEGTESWL